MTILTAVSAKIEPYSVSDEALEVNFTEAADFLGVSASVEDTYVVGEHLKAVTLAAMKILSGLRTLASENLGGLSNTYDRSQINAMIKALAKSAGLPLSLVGVDEGGEMYVKAVHVW